MKYAFVAATLATVVSAQSPAWGQCGGNNWTGPKTCASGSTCTYNNDWYSQCIPGANPQPTTTTRAQTTTTTTTRGGQATSSTTAVRTTTTSAGGNPVTTPTTTRTTSAGGNPVTTGPVVTASGNPFSGVQPFVNPFYASEILTLAVPSLPASLRPAASAVAKIPTFAWLDTISKIEPLLEGNLALISAANKAGANPPIAGQFVVYDLPDRDCAAAASNGELASASGGSARYKAEYIDVIRAKLQKYSDVKVILVIEPDSLANMITNLGVAKCSAAQSQYIENTIYAIKQLALPNVTMYLDGGHGGWLGWPANLALAAPFYAKLYKDAGAPKQLRGFAVNVSNYNAWTIATCPKYTSPNPNCDEKKYIEAFAPLLASSGWSDVHFIMDTSRNGVQPTAQIEQGNWCNVIGTGFGLRPGAATGSSLLDSFVWIKPGGEADGTSDTTATRYDFHCGSADALKPAPEAGTWFQAYFEQLLKNANPSFQ